MKTKYVFLLLSLFLVISCEKLEVAEDDPNNFSNAPGKLMINQPLLAVAQVYNGHLARSAGVFANYFTGEARQYQSLNKYVINAGDFDNMWEALYANGIAQAQIVQEKAAELNDNELIAVAEIAEAALAGIAADCWGNVPYSETNNPEEFPNPQYDPQLDVYASIQALLDDALTKLQGGSPSYGEETIDPTSLDLLSWTEIAHSLKARYFLHVRDYDNAIIHAAQGISSFDGEWLINCTPGSPGGWNTYYDFMEWNRNGYLGASDAYLANILDTASADYYAVSDAKTNESGRFDLYYLTDPYYPNTDDGGKFADIAPLTVFGYPEVQLIIAESHLRKTSPDFNAALAALNNVRAYNEAKYGGPYDPYVAADFANNNELLRAILLEKYISLYGQVEGWTDLRRTDNELNIPYKEGQSQLPERFIYPQLEANANANFPGFEDIFEPTPVNQ